MAATAATTPEYDLKAAFLFHFVRFVEWPADAFPKSDTPFTIGILGEDPFGGSLDEIVANERVGERPLVVRRLHGLEHVAGCQILFVCPSEVDRIEHVIGRLRSSSVLTVGDTGDFAARGGVIGFVAVRNRLRLQVNLAAAEAARLTISSKVLRQAELVGPKTQATPP